MQQKTLMLLILASTLGWARFASADCSNAPACPFDKQPWSSASDITVNSLYMTHDQAQARMNLVLAGDKLCKGSLRKLDRDDNSWAVDYCKIPDKKAEAAAAKFAADPLTNLDCNNLKLAPDVVRDPAYYYDAMRGLRATEAKLNEFLANKNATAFDPGDAQHTLKMIQGWLSPTLRRYSQVKDIESQLNECFSGDSNTCHDNDDDTFLDKAKTLKVVTDEIHRVEGINKDMQAKLATMSSCDPYVQTKPGKDTFATKLARLQKKLKTPAQMQALRDAADAQCKAPSTPLGQNNTTIQTLLVVPAATATPSANPQIPFIDTTAPVIDSTLPLPMQVPNKD